MAVAVVVVVAVAVLVAVAVAVVPVVCGGIPAVCCFLRFDAANTSRF